MLMTTNYQKEPDPEVEIRGVVPTYVKPKADKTTLVTISGSDIIASALPTIQGESDFRMLTENPQVFGFIYTHRDSMTLVADGYTYMRNNPNFESAMLTLYSLRQMTVPNSDKSTIHCMGNASAIVSLNPREDGNYFRNRFMQGSKDFLLRDFEFVIDPTSIQNNCPVYFFMRDIAELKQYIIDISQYFKDKPNSQGIVRKLPAYGTKDAPKPLKDITINFSDEVNLIKRFLNQVPNENGIDNAFTNNLKANYTNLTQSTRIVLKTIYSKLYEMLKQDMSGCMLCVSNDTFRKEYSGNNALEDYVFYMDYSPYRIVYAQPILVNFNNGNSAGMHSEDTNTFLYYSMFPGKSASRNYKMYYQQEYAKENVQKFFMDTANDPSKSFLYNYENPFYTNAMFLKELSAEDLAKGRITLKNVPVVEGKVNSFSYYIGIPKRIWTEITKWIKFYVLNGTITFTDRDAKQGNFLLFGDVFNADVKNFWKFQMSCTVISALSRSAYNGLFSSDSPQYNAMNSPFPAKFSVDLRENPLTKTPLSPKFSSGYMLGYPFVMIKNLSLDYELTKATLYTVKSDSSREEHIAYTRGNNKETLGDMVFPKVVTRRDLYSTEPLNSSKSKETPYFTVAFPYALKPLVEPYAELTFTNTKTGKVQEFNSIPLFGEHINRIYYSNISLYHPMINNAPYIIYDADTKTLYLQINNLAVLGNEIGIESIDVIKKQAIGPDQFGNAISVYNVPLTEEHKKTFKCRNRQSTWRDADPFRIFVPYGSFYTDWQTIVRSEIFSKDYHISDDELRARKYKPSKESFTAKLPMTYNYLSTITISLSNIDIPEKYFSENPQIVRPDYRRYKLFLNIKLRTMTNINSNTQGQPLVGYLGTSSSSKYAEEVRNNLDNILDSTLYKSFTSTPYFLNSITRYAYSSLLSYDGEDSQPKYGEPSSELASVLDPIGKDLTKPIIKSYENVSSLVVTSNSRNKASLDFHDSYGANNLFASFDLPQKQVATDTKLSDNGKELFWESFALKNKAIRIL